MTATKLAADPLWQCLCPTWARAAIPAATTARLTSPPLSQRTPKLSIRRNALDTRQTSRRCFASSSRTHAESVYIPNSSVPIRRHTVSGDGLPPPKKALPEKQLWHQETPYLCTQLHALSIRGKVKECREIVELLVRDRGEKPNEEMYTALILSNADHEHGAAWRVEEYLDEMRECGLQFDQGVCNAVLRALAVHPDHLLRSDVLEYMRTRWFALTEHSMHAVAAGLWREALFEQALERMDLMTAEGVKVQPWLLDMAVHVLCEAGEVEEAYRIMRQRTESLERNISRTLWYVLLDTGAAACHAPCTKFAWREQVAPGYIRPSDGICRNILATASQAGDVQLATDVFAFLAQRGTVFQPIHYQLLIDCYVAQDPVDLDAAFGVLSIMSTEKLEPTPAETRELYAYLRDRPEAIDESLDILRHLHSQHRKIPLAALNLLIECCIEQGSLDRAMDIYKLVHTFNPASQPTQKTFVDIETFNILLRGCRMADPPDDKLAGFLISELVTLKILPTALTYDRLILVLVQAAVHAFTQASATTDSSEVEKHRLHGLRMLDYACRHFIDMLGITASKSPLTTNESNPSSPSEEVEDPKREEDSLPFLPRFGTLDALARELAKVGDERCWEVLRVGQEYGPRGIGNWAQKGRSVVRTVEREWAKSTGGVGGEGGGDEGGA